MAVDVVDKTAYNHAIKILLIAVGLGAFTDNYDSTILGASSFTLIPAMHVSIPQFGVLGSMSFLGGIFGAASFGPLADRFGRKRTFLATLAIFAVAQVLMSLAQNYPELLILRTMVGFGIGADYAPAAVYLSELAPANRRGKYFGFFWILYGMGLVCAYIMGYGLLFLVGALQWRVLFLTGAVPPILGIMVRSRIVESPRWYVDRGEIEKAKNAMQTLGLNPDDVLKYKTKETTTARLSLIIPYILPVTIPLAIVSILSQTMTTGLSVFDPLIFSSLGVSQINSLLFSGLTFGLPHILGAFVVYFVIDRIGRFKLYVWGLGLSALFMIASYFVASPNTIAPLLIIVSAANVTTYWFTALNQTIAAELYPTKIRGVGQGINAGAFRSSGIVASLVGAFLLVAFGAGAILLCYGVFGGIALLIVVFWVGSRRLRTEKRELEEISQGFTRSQQ